MKIGKGRQADLDSIEILSLSIEETPETVTFSSVLTEAEIMTGYIVILTILTLYTLPRACVPIIGDLSFSSRA